METRTIVHNELCVEVSEKLWADERRRKTFGAKLFQVFNPDKSDDTYYTWFEDDLAQLIAALAQTRSHSGFEMPSVLDTPEVLMQKVEALGALPEAFMQEWIETAALLRQPKADPDLVPPGHLTESQKKVKK